jgi:hypothetical protein
MEKENLIKDSNGKGIHEAQYSMDYNFLYNSPHNKIYDNYSIPKPESESYEQINRLNVIAFLRKAYRENPVVNSIIWRFAATVGCPKFESVVGDKELEFTLYQSTKNIVYGKKFNWQKFNQLIYSELCIAGEIFFIKTNEGKLQMVPAEMVGSPSDPNLVPMGEKEGLKFKKNGELEYIRVGKYVAGGISYTEPDAVKVKGEYVYHFTTDVRVDENRSLPLLCAAITDIVQMAANIQAKDVQIKNQSLFALFIKKNMDPALYANMIKDGSLDPSIIGKLNSTLVSTKSASLKNGSIMIGQPNESVEKITADYNSADFIAHITNRLTAICSVLQMPVQFIIGFGDSSFSSAKMESIRFKAMIDVIRNNSEPFYDFVKEFVCDYTNKKPTETTLAWPMIADVDSLRTAQTNVMLYNNGLMSKAQVVKNTEYWSEDLDSQLIDEAVVRYTKLKERADKLGINIKDLIAMMPNGGNLATQINTIESTNNTNETK